MNQQSTLEDGQIIAATSLAMQNLAAVQQDNGGFLSFSCPSEQFIHPLIERRTTFFTSLILSCLNEESSPVAENIKSAAAQFLLKEKSSTASFNYWQKESSEYTSLPYPDDLDDTFCALSALSIYRPALIDGALLAQVVSLLMATEKQPGGPYKTWLMPADSAEVWQDYDIVVNSNVAYFLSLQRVSLPGLIEFLEQKIINEDYNSPYYPSVYPVIYFLSRAYQGTHKARILKFLKSRQLPRDNTGNPLNAALTMIASLKLGDIIGDQEEGVQFLLDSQLPDGSWPPQAFCFDPSIDGQSHVASSSALTTAFCVEALNLFRYCRQAATKLNFSETSLVQQKLQQQIIIQAQSRLDKLPADLNTVGQAVLEKTLARDPGQSITLLPYRFQQALGTKGQQVSMELIQRLGLANLYGWIAYTIYDDILDDEPQPELLPLANVCLRDVTDIYGGFDSEFQKIFQTTMDELEGANSWETRHTRWPLQTLPDYADFTVLAQKSFGHALGPLAILFCSGFNQQSEEFINIKTFFHHYLIARQLNDDAHDWQEDLAQGRVNAVGSTVLGQWLESSGSALELLKPEFILLELQEIFWIKIIYETCDLISRHLSSAKRMITSTSLIVDPSPLLVLLEPLEQAVVQAQTETKKAQDFLSAYK